MNSDRLSHNLTTEPEQVRLEKTGHRVLKGHACGLRQDFPLQSIFQGSVLFSVTRETGVGLCPLCFCGVALARKRFFLIIGQNFPFLYFLPLCFMLTPGLCSSWAGMVPLLIFIVNSAV